MLRVSQLVCDFPEMEEMDLNPVHVLAVGKGAIAVDARIKLAGPKKPQGVAGAAAAVLRIVGHDGDATGDAIRRRRRAARRAGASDLSVSSGDRQCGEGGLRSAAVWVNLP